jgi:Fic family protein
MQVIDLLKEYQALNLSQNIDYDKFNRYSITHHSTSVEGSTLTEIETNLLLDEGLTPKGKPIEHSLMTIDHENALLFIIEKSKQKTIIDTAFIQQINAKVMAKTGNVYHTIFGEIDGSKGSFRKGNVVAGNRYFPNFDKVEILTQKLTQTISSKLNLCTQPLEQLQLSFDTHFDLVSIHPFYDGNGRTSRLLMNYIQLYFNLPMSFVFKEDKADYIQSLEDSREQEDLKPFRNFMNEQYIKFLTKEIQNYKSINKKNNGGGFSMIF